MQFNRLVQSAQPVILLLTLLLLTAGLTACGGADNTETSSGTEAAEASADKAATNNPLASEQQLMKDAGALQGMLDEDAKRKKQAVEDAN